MQASPPLSITTLQDGTIWISAFEYGIDANSVTHGFPLKGKLELFFGSYGMKSGKFLCPTAMTTSPDGDLFILNGGTRTIQHLDRQGHFLGRFGNKESSRENFNMPLALVVGRQFLYILDYENRQVQHLTLEGQYFSRCVFCRTRDSDELRVLGRLGMDEHSFTTLMAIKFIG